MLIYNYNKEFLGIDEVDLQTLGFQDLSALQAQVSDFADLFVKTPGYIHNFKHVHWIDFITCSDSTELPKVIIHVHNVSYRCNLKITTIYLSDNPTEKAFIVNLQNLRILSDNESGTISSDLSFKQSQSTQYVPPMSPVFEQVKITPLETIHEKPLQQEFKEELHIDEVPQQVDLIKDEYDDFPLEVHMEKEPLPAPEPMLEAQKVTVAPQIHHEEVVKSKADTVATEHEYVFDPHVASKELGLPVDLIEEFIQDFIAQAKEFKDELYTSLHELNISNVKILSHKLKGVAANLRVADALETLTLVNTSSDFPVIHTNLDKFYKIIAKLAGEAPIVETTIQSTRSDEDEFVVDFKEDLDAPLELIIDDSDVPNAIAMPELADDDFSPVRIEEISTDLLDIDFEAENEDDLSLEDSSINELLSPQETSDDEDTLELLSLDDEEIKPVVLLQTHEKSNIEVTYNRENIANEIGIDLDSFNELFEDFLNEGQFKCKQIREAINNENTDLWKAKAMKLKGMSENMRIKELSQALDAIIKTFDSQVALDSIDKIDVMMSQISQKEA
jgi:HPt (histidine-containing phosphotransfer) domain-containing protein